MNKHVLSDKILINSITLNEQATVDVVQPAPTFGVGTIRLGDQLGQQDRIGQVPILIRNPPLIKQPISKLPTVQPRVTIQPEETRWINPRLGLEIANIREHKLGIARDRVTLPVSPTAEVTDATLFEDPKDASQQFYLPRYRLVERNQQVQMFLIANGQQWQLVIHLEQYPAASLSTAVRDAKVIDHTVSLILEHRLIAGDVNGGQREWVFPEMTAEAGELLAVLPIATRDERDLLYQALTEAAYGANLIIRRSINVAIPSTSAQNVSPAFSYSDANEAAIQPGQNFKQLTIVYPKPDWIGFEIEFQGKATLDHFFLYFSTTDQQGAEIAVRCYGNAFEVAAATQPGLHNQVVYRGVPVISENRYAFVIPWEEVFGELEQAALWLFAMQGRDRLPDQGEITFSRTMTQQTPLYRQVTRVLDDSPRIPFVFPAALYGYMFQGITGTPTKDFKPIPYPANGHSYYQDPVQKYLFYYLPDSFKLVRRPESPHYPMVSVRFNLGESAEDVQATIEYWAYPYVNAARLEAASAALNKPHITGPLPKGVNGIVFQPLVASKPRLFLGLPHAEGGFPTKERPDVLVELRTGFRDALTLSLTDFQTVYDALFVGDTQLFQGYVQVDAPDGTKPINFIARMNDMVGDYFDYTQEIDTVSGTIRVTLKNAIESPVQVSRLGVQLMQESAPVPCSITGFSASSPVTLKPEEGLSFTVVPTVAVALTNSVDLVFDLTGTQVLTDREGVFNSILRGHTTAVYKRPIVIKTDRSVFGDRIQVISIDLKQGGSVDFTRDDAQLEAKQDVFAPIKNLIVGSEDGGAYEYRVTLILTDGRKVEDPADSWRTTTSEPLWITHSELPAITP